MVTQELLRVKRRHGRYTVHRQGCLYLRQAKDQGTPWPEGQNLTVDQMLDMGAIPCFGEHCFPVWRR